MTATSRRWLARAPFALMLAAVALLIAVAGWRSLTLVALAVVGACAVLAGGYWFLANRGLARWLALLLVWKSPTGVHTWVRVTSRPQCLLRTDSTFPGLVAAPVRSRALVSWA